MECMECRCHRDVRLLVAGIYTAPFATPRTGNVSVLTSVTGASSVLQCHVAHYPSPRVSTPHTLSLLSPHTAAAPRTGGGQPATAAGRSSLGHRPLRSALPPPPAEPQPAFLPAGRHRSARPAQHNPHCSAHQYKTQTGAKPRHCPHADPCNQRSLAHALTALHNTRTFRRTPSATPHYRCHWGPAVDGHRAGRAGALGWPAARQSCARLARWYACRSRSYVVFQTLQRYEGVARLQCSSGGHRVSVSQLSAPPSHGWARTPGGSTSAGRRPAAQRPAGRALLTGAG